MNIDIIVPTYNRPEHLKKLVKEISKQSYPSYQVYIVDDNSACDNKSVIPKDNKYKYFRLQKNLGQTFARNFALGQSKGEIVIFLDDDAWFMDDDALVKIIKYFDEDDHLGCLMFDLQEPGKEWLSRQKNLKDGDHIGSFIACACAFRKEALQKIGGFTDFLHSYGEETDLALKLLPLRYNVKFAKGVKVFHNYYPDKRSEEWYLRFRKNSIRNDVLIIMMRFPWYAVPPFIVGKFFSHLKFTLMNKRNVLAASIYTLSGFFSAIGMLNKAIAQRKPLSQKLFKVWLKIRW